MFTSLTYATVGMSTKKIYYKQTQHKTPPKNTIKKKLLF